MIEFVVTNYFCVSLGGRAFLSTGSCRLAVVPNHSDNPKEYGVKDTEPSMCRTAATQLVAIGRLLR
jgi:hypothetical protein